MLNRDRVKALFDGSKEFWREKKTINIIILDHIDISCIELIALCPDFLNECSKLYFNSEALSSILDQQEFTFQMKTVQEQLLIKNKSVSNKSLTRKVTSAMIVNFLLDHLHLKSQLNNSNIKLSFTQKNGEDFNKDFPALIISKPQKLCEYENRKEISSMEGSCSAFDASKIIHFHDKSYGGDRNGCLKTTSLMPEIADADGRDPLIRWSTVAAGTPSTGGGNLFVSSSVTGRTAEAAHGMGVLSRKMSVDDLHIIENTNSSADLLLGNISDRSNKDGNAKSIRHIERESATDLCSSVPSSLCQKKQLVNAKVGPEEITSSKTAAAAATLKVRLPLVRELHVDITMSNKSSHHHTQQLPQHEEPTVLPSPNSSKSATHLSPHHHHHNNPSQIIADNSSSSSRSDHRDQNANTTSSQKDINTQSTPQQQHHYRGSTTTTSLAAAAATTSKGIAVVAAHNHKKQGHVVAFKDDDEFEFSSSDDDEDNSDNSSCGTSSNSSKNGNDSDDSSCITLGTFGRKNSHSNHVEGLKLVEKVGSFRHSADSEYNYAASKKLSTAIPSSHSGAAAVRSSTTVANYNNSSSIGGSSNSATTSSGIPLSPHYQLNNNNIANRRPSNSGTTANNNSLVGHNHLLVPLITTSSSSGGVAGNPSRNHTSRVLPQLASSPNIIGGSSSSGVVSSKLLSPKSVAANNGSNMPCSSTAAVTTSAVNKNLPVVSAPVMIRSPKLKNAVHLLRRPTAVGGYAVGTLVLDGCSNGNTGRLTSTCDRLLHASYGGGGGGLSSSSTYNNNNNGQNTFHNNFVTTVAAATHPSSLSPLYHHNTNIASGSNSTSNNNSGTNSIESSPTMRYSLLPENSSINMSMTSLHGSSSKNSDCSSSKSNSISESMKSIHHSIRMRGGAAAAATITSANTTTTSPSESVTMNASSIIDSSDSKMLRVGTLCAIDALNNNTSNSCSYHTPVYDINNHNSSSARVQLNRCYDSTNHAPVGQLKRLHMLETVSKPAAFINNSNGK